MLSTLSKAVLLITTVDTWHSNRHIYCLKHGKLIFMPSYCGFICQCENASVRDSYVACLGSLGWAATSRIVSICCQAAQAAKASVGTVSVTGIHRY